MLQRFWVMMLLSDNKTWSNVGSFTSNIDAYNHIKNVCFNGVYKVEIVYIINSD